VYAGISPEVRRLNLQDDSGPYLPDKVQSALHIDSGTVFGHTSASTMIVLTFSGGERWSL